MTGHLYTAARSAQRAEAALSLPSVLLFALALRIAAHFALPAVVEGDGATTLALATRLATGQMALAEAMRQAIAHMFYPLYLAPFFALFGAGTNTVFLANTGLAMGSALLVRAIARECALTNFGQQLAVLFYALWLPCVWACTTPACENLTTPLLLAVAWLSLRLLQQGARIGTGSMTGIAIGAAVLTGVPVLPLVAPPLLAIGLAANRRLRAMAPPLLAMAAGAILILAPWAGTPPPGAPVTPGYAVSRHANAGAAAVSPPAFGTRRVVLFWWPNLPDRADFTAIRAIALVRIGEVAQYLLFITLGLAALLTGPVEGRRRAVIGVLAGTFWALHGLAQVIDRYRDPVMPLLIVFAAGTIAEFLQRRMRREFRRPPDPQAA